MLRFIRNLIRVSTYVKNAQKSHNSYICECFLISNINSRANTYESVVVIKHKLTFSKILLVVIPSRFWGHLRLHSVYVENLIQSDVVAICLSSGIRLLHIQLHVFH